MNLISKKNKKEMEEHLHIQRTQKRHTIDKY